MKRIIAVAISISGAWFLGPFGPEIHSLALKMVETATIFAGFLALIQVAAQAIVSRYRKLVEAVELIDDLNGDLTA
jgi:hypothetical protein